MPDVVTDHSFLALIALSSTLLYRFYLPRLLAREQLTHAPSSESAPGLSGTRYLGWVASTALVVLSLGITYHLLRQSHPPSIVFAAVIALSWVCILSGHRFHRPSPAERVPEVRFGTTVGWLIAAVLYFLLAGTLLP